MARTFDIPPLHPKCPTTSPPSRYALEYAVAEPFAFVAVTEARCHLGTSPADGVYELQEVAPGMAVQLPVGPVAPASLICHSQDVEVAP